jgi:hypothetical protein
MSILLPGWHHSNKKKKVKSGKFMPLQVPNEFSDYIDKQMENSTMNTQIDKGQQGISALNKMIRDKLVEVPLYVLSDYSDFGKAANELEKLFSEWQKTQPIHSISEEELDKLAKKHSDGMDASFWDYGIPEETVKEWAENYFKTGYKAAQPNKYSIEDIILWLPNSGLIFDKKGWIDKDGNEINPEKVKEQYINKLK